jgi:hypothetical protein
MGMFAKRIQQKEKLVRNGAQPLETANVRQEAKTERARANRLRLNAAKKHNGGNQMRGGQNKKKGRKAPIQIEIVISAEQITATEYGRLMLDFAETVAAL